MQVVPYFRVVSKAKVGPFFLPLLLVEGTFPHEQVPQIISNAWVGPHPQDIIITVLLCGTKTEVVSGAKITKSVIPLPPPIPSSFKSYRVQLTVQKSQGESCAYPAKQISRLHMRDVR